VKEYIRRKIEFSKDDISEKRIDAFRKNEFKLFALTNKVSSLRTILNVIAFLMVFIFFNPVVGQNYFPSQKDMEKALAEAKKSMIAQQGDNAINITEPLMIQLKKEGRYDSHFGFQVRMIHGLALYHSSKEVASLEFLWKLKDESRKHQDVVCFGKCL
jgi:hypothetical protein